MGSKNTDLKMNPNSRGKSSLKELSGHDLMVIKENTKNESFEDLLGAFIAGISIVSVLYFCYIGLIGLRSNCPGRAVGTSESG